MMNPKKALTAAAVASLLAGAVASANAVTFTPGDILVTRVVAGSVDTTQINANGVAPIVTPLVPQGNGIAGTVVIDEYDPSNFTTPVMSITLPNVQQTNTTAGSSYALTFSGTQNQEGTILNSLNNEFFSLTGYNQTAGVQTATGANGTNAAPSSTVQRVVGLISLNGTINTTTGLTDAVSTVSVRSAYTTDGTNIWINGATKNLAQLGGVHYATVGSNTSTQITAFDSGAGSDILGGFNFGSGPQLLLGNLKNVSQASPPAAAAFRGIAQIGDATQGPGAGTPTSFSNTTFPTQLAGFNANTTLANGQITDNYWFKDANTLYIADNRSCTTVATTATNSSVYGGVQKWAYQDTNADGILDSWVLQYNVPLGLGEGAGGSQTGAGVGAHGLAGKVDHATGNVDLYTTTFDVGANRNDLYEVVDNGSNLTIANGGLPLAVSGANDTMQTDSAFRGVAVVPNFTLGDANLDGRVDLTDLSVVLNNFGATTNAWDLGNFDGAATVDLTDLSDVLNNFGAITGSSSPSAAAAIGTPEPASVGLLGLGVVGYLMRRRRA